MVNQKNEKLFHNLFLIGIFIKGLDGVLETIGGVFLIFLKTDFIVKLVKITFNHELVQDPTDFVANYIVKYSQSISIDTLSFVSIYLIIHGVIKLSLFIGLWQKRIWVYPVAGVILFLFSSYQFVRILHTHSFVLTFLTLVDVSIIVLLRFEYLRIKMSTNKI
ncbi:MAG: DUF2127 domain-containing protein [Patescibacteria group bacterium]|jgi:uncharacterized membrane protein|nr:DUF2127 domain-containing protein [Patescibacteria group bacterium]